MHFTNNNEMNSNAILSADWNAKSTATHQTGFSATSARDSVKISTTTSSADSCASSTDSGVIISENKRTCSNDSNNYKNIQGNINLNTNSVDINGTNGNTAKDNSNNIDNSGNDKRRRSEESSQSNKNITINKKIDNKSNGINIENIINVRRQRNSSSGSSRKSSKNCSPALSIRSNTISIISIDENAIDSSVVDSDSDFEGQSSNYVVKKLGQQTTYEPNHPNLPNINKGMQVLSQTISPGAVPPTSGPLSETILNGGVLSPPILGPTIAPNSAQIGSIALSNSTDVTFGDKHFYEGPVTIQQFLIDSRDKWKKGEEDGNDNPTFTDDGKLSDPENATKSNGPPTLPETPYKFIFNRRAVIITGSIILLTILIGIVIITVNSLTKQTIRKSKILGDGDDSRKHIPINSTIEPLEDSEYVFNGSLLIISKDEWYAEAVEDDIEKLKLPVPRVIIAHTASTTCENKVQCDARVQSIQAFHIHSNGWSDVGYNFLIGGNGLVYEGRGWYQLGAHMKGYNRESIGIAFIGTFIEEVPTENDLKAAKLLIEEANDNIGGGKILRIVPRDGWLAQPPSADPVPLATPVHRVIVLSTLTDDCETQAMCVYRVRMTQTLNIESQNHDDIIYNFLIGGDGNVYEGRGWDVTGAHLRGFNVDSVSFAYIGTFKKQKPSEKQMDVTKLLLEEGVRLGKLSPDYKIYGAYMLDPTLTDAKADELYNSFKGWPHWSEYLISANAK